MDPIMEALGTLLADIADLGAVAEDHGINRLPPLDPLTARARELGVDVPVPATLDDLREAVEAHCRHRDEVYGLATNHHLRDQVLGNESGAPGGGP